jgi:hypothetical protein
MRPLFLSLLLCLPLPAAADVIHTRAGFDCQRERDRLILTYDMAANHAGEKMAEKASATQWAPEVTYDEEGFVRDIGREQGVCRLSDGEYRIEIYANPGNSNVQRMCGAWVGAGVKVSKDGKTLFAGNFDECQRHDWPTIRRVLIRPGKEPVRRVSDTHLGLLFTAACQPAQGVLRLDFVFGETLAWRAEPPGVNDIESLLAHADGSDNYQPFNIEASCRLRDGEYRYILRPFFAEGKACGAARWANALLTITRDGETIYDAPFTKDCAAPEVVRGVAIRLFEKPRANPLEVHTIPAALFYDPEADPEVGFYPYRIYPKGKE